MPFYQTDLNKWYQHVTDKLKRNLKAGWELRPQLITFCEIKKTQELIRI